ncbi:uncharacterized protein LOC106164071 [Lingula anatina]|uniref:Uncharacterized protein LOC106164071 n=1 Tax=Lingula anatina TaxID=7574 RepID=A0A1S3IHG6_LINAN|nr:uncharacterized protein LOC106164071 [Lingula anatina]|eukprot:XP_013397316.1 uncharacterized protein LOC106164071 [Lingula anatina]
MMSRLVAVFCVLVNGVNLARATCSFPETLLTDNWQGHYIPSASQGNKVLQANFTTDQMDVQLRSSVVCSRRCISAIGDVSNSYVNGQTYVVRETCGSDAVTFRCVHFLNRSTTVIQLKSSKFPLQNLPLNTEGFCTDDNLGIESWPLARPLRDETEFEDCPLTGGFEMTLGTNTKYLLPNFPRDVCSPLALDGSCLPGEKLSFDFKDRFCVPAKVRLTWKSSLQGSCTASWQDGNYTLMLFAAEGQYKTISRYTLRFPANNRNIMNATLFASPALGSPEPEDSGLDVGAPAVELHLKRPELRGWSDLCQDNQDDCDWAICDGRYGPYGHRCLRSCGHCNDTYNRIATRCEFPSNYSGSWRTASNSVFTVISGTIVVPEYGDMTCIDFQSPDLPNRFVVLSMPNNGCRPRYKCLDLEKTDGKLRWRINNGFEPWPGYGVRLPSFTSVCNETLRDWTEWETLSRGIQVTPSILILVLFVLAELFQAIF